MDIKAIVERILLYFLEVFAYFGFATQEDVDGFKGYIDAQKDAE